MYRSWLIDAFKEVLMKDEKQYEWVDVTRECEFDSFLMDTNRGIYGIRVKGPFGYAHFAFNGTDSFASREYTRVVHFESYFRIERRVEVEQPKEVLIHTTIIGGDDIVHQRRISYQSAKELGLI